TARKLFWTKRAQEAYLQYSKQQKGADKADKTADRVDEESWRDDLIQANVEVLYSIYCFDLTGYYNRLQKDKTRRWDTMNERDQKNAPAGTGWLVEVRGYTWHKGGLEFISKAVVDNLARLPIKKAAEGAATQNTAAQQTAQPGTQPAT